MSYHYLFYNLINIDNFYDISYFIFLHLKSYYSFFKILKILVIFKYINNRNANYTQISNY